MAHAIPPADLAALSPVQKMELADILYDTAQQELEAATVPLTDQQRQEIDRRCAELDVGRATTHDWDTVYAQLLRES